MRTVHQTLAVAFGATLYALMAFAIHLRWFPIGDLGVESDFYAELVVSAQRLVDGQFAVSNYPFKGPLYSFLLAALHFVTQRLGADWYDTAVLLNALCAAAGLVVLFSMLRRLFGPGLATAATISTALCIEFFLHAQKASSDLLYLLLFLGTVSALLGRLNSQRMLVAGVLTGLAFLTRYSGGVLLVGGLFTLGMLPELGKWRQRVVLAGFFVTGFLLVSIPWFFLNLSATGHFLNDGNLMNVVLEYYSGEREGLIPDGGFQSLGHLISQDPNYFIRHFLANIPHHFKQDLIQLVGARAWPLVVGALVGILLSFLPRLSTREFFRQRRPDRQQVVFFIFAGISFLAMCLVFHRPRFSLPLVPAYFVLAYGVIFGFMPMVKRSARNHRITLVVATLVVLVVSTVQIQDIIRGEHYYYAQRPLQVLRQAPRVRILAAETLSTTLLARKPHLAHYSGLDPVAYPSSIQGWDQFLSFALAHKADLIAVGPQERGILGETMILNYLDRAPGITRLEETDGLLIYHFNRNSGPQAFSADFPEFRARVVSATQTGDSNGVFVARFEWGLALMPLAQWEKAQSQLGYCKQMVTDDPGIIGTEDQDYLLVNLAFIDLKLGDPQAGIALLGENLSHLSPVDDPYLQGLRHFVLGRLQADMGRTAEAKNNYQIAHSAYLKAGNKAAVQEVLLYLGHLDQ